MKEQDTSQKVYQCYHCGNKTLMNCVGNHTENCGDENFSAYFKSLMYICPVCQRTTYIECYSDESMMEYGGKWYEDEKICYPIISLETTHIPDKIRIAFEGALKSRNTDSALCLIGLRRTLEMICKEQGSTEKNLDGKIKDLVKKNILPPTLREATDIARRFGNSAAHADEIEVSIHELNLIIEFVEAVIDYIYVLPQKMLKFREIK